MTGSFGDILEDEILDHIFGCTTRDYTSPTNIFVALSTADPLDDGTGMAEPSGNGYARESTSGTDWDVSSGGSTANATEISFTEATGSWGTITHFALFDAITAGNMLAHGDLTTSKAIDDGDTARFPIGNITVSLV